MKKKATIKDVALKAGVSIATVSFVLNKRPGQAISEQVAKRVLQAAEEINYHPNAAAAGLARKRSRNVAIVFYRESQLISNQFYSFVIEGAIRTAIERDYNLLFTFVETNYRDSRDLPKVIREANAEGALFMRRIEPRMVRDIQARGIPVVAVDQYPHFASVDSLGIDNVTGATLATEHLLELGHERIVFMRAARQRPSIAERGRGFRNALKAAGIACRNSTHIWEAPSLNFRGAYSAACELLAKRPRPTAVFCANDEVAAAVIRAGHEAGLRIPEQLSVVGFDDITMSSYTNPPLTTVGVAKQELGALAMLRLLELVETGEQPARQALVPVQLVVRGSTAKIE